METEPDLSPYLRDRARAEALGQKAPEQSPAATAILVVVPILAVALALTWALAWFGPQPREPGRITAAAQPPANSPPAKSAPVNADPASSVAPVPAPTATAALPPQPLSPSPQPTAPAAPARVVPVAPAQTAAAGLSRATIAPAIPWRSLAPESRLTRIGIGSCLDQRKPQPIWQGVLGLARRPEVFLMIGDNVYGDIKSPDGAELIAAYREQASQPELAAVRAAVPFLATWDDHDYGGNDAGATYEHRVLAARLFHEFWQKEPERPFEQGIHSARTFGPPGQRVQVIMLDTRSFRSDLVKKTDAFPHWGKYAPIAEASRTMLGETQWAWLEQQLREPAQIRLVISSVQVLAEGHGFERWGNLPLERERLAKLIEATGAGGTILVSGDRHIGAMYTRTLPNGQLLAELTTSSLNRAYGPSKDARTPELVSALIHQENFGLVDIDWQGAKVVLGLNGIDGGRLEAIELDFDAIGVVR